MPHPYLVLSPYELVKVDSLINIPTETFSLLLDVFFGLVEPEDPRVKHALQVLNTRLSIFKFRTTVR